MTSMQDPVETPPYFTMKWSEDLEADVPVGELAVNGVTKPREEFSLSPTTKVFLSHTGSDNTKRDIARPTHWFLTNVLKVSAFIDESNLMPGAATTKALLQEAYECTHALCILSKNYRARQFCVQELNTFMKRRHEYNDVSVIPALWEIMKPEGYNEAVKKVVWIHNSETRDLVDYLTRTLWPRLIMTLKLPEMNAEFLEDCIVRYTDENRGELHAIPREFDRLVQRKKELEAVANRTLKPWQKLCLVLLFLLGVGGLVYSLVRDDNNSGEDSPQCRMDEDCDSLICLDDTCCEECRRVVLTSVMTGGDGGGGSVEPTYWVNGQQIYPIRGGIGKAPENRLHHFPVDEPYPQMGDIRPERPLQFLVREHDPFGEPDEFDATVPLDEWYRGKERTSYSLSKNLTEGWIFNYDIETHCCTTI